MKIPTKLLYSMVGLIGGCTVTTILVTSNAAMNTKTVQADSESLVTSESSYVMELSSNQVSSNIASSKISSNVNTEKSSNITSKISQPVSSNIVSSITSNQSNQSTIQSATESAVSKIHSETEKSVSKIQETASSAVEEVKSAVSESVQNTSSTQTHKVICDTNKISGLSYTVGKDGKHSTWDIRCENSMSLVDEENKTVIINYNGHFDGRWENVSELKAYGFTVKDANGNEIDFEQEDFCRMKVPYDDLSDVSTLYLCYEDQSIKISVT